MQITITLSFAILQCGSCNALCGDKIRISLPSTTTSSLLNNHMHIRYEVRKSNHRKPQSCSLPLNEHHQRGSFTFSVRNFAWYTWGNESTSLFTHKAANAADVGFHGTMSVETYSDSNRPMSMLHYSTRLAHSSTFIARIDRET